MSRLPILVVPTGLHIFDALGESSLRGLDITEFIA